MTSNSDNNDAPGSDNSEQLIQCVYSSHNESGQCTVHFESRHIFPQIQKGLKIACHNINRLINLNDTVTLDQLKPIICSNNPPADIYCICETFLTDRTDDDFVKINGFAMV